MLIFPATFSPVQEINLTTGLTITHSVKIRKAEFNRPSGDDTGTKGILMIRGDNITVDFNGATLRGTSVTTPPDQRKGTALSISGKNITIKNLNVHGYKIGLIARNCPGLRILNCDLSYNWKQHLLSTPEREDESDWMSYHQNEKDEWLRYGVGIYLRGCDDFEVKGCTITGGQCGLMLMQCNKGKVWNNSFSFLSGVGLGMYRSSDNTAMHNKIDWCVRGFSYGVYNRGQDSTGILIYELSNKNVFAYNSVTHGGDGFFLWAGQTTMDTGEGGCNDNLLYGNDFSHSPANGIEATFSRNNFVNNLILECWHGIWGGYGYESKVIGNVFGYNAEAISWEHGQDNQVLFNTFDFDNEGIVLWADPQVDPNWGYANKRDIRSRDWRIAHNVMKWTYSNALRVSNTLNLGIDQNLFSQIGKLFAVTGENPRMEFSANQVDGRREALNIPPGVIARENHISEISYGTNAPQSSLTPGEAVDDAAYGRRFDKRWNPFAPPYSVSITIDRLAWKEARGREMAKVLPPDPLPGGQDAFLKPGTLRGWRYIIVDEWGPYDFKAPILWPRGAQKQSVEEAGRIPGTARETVYKFSILGPKGKWRVKQLKGLAWHSADEGDVPGSISVKLPPGKASDLLIELEYTGKQVVSPWGRRLAAHEPYVFSYRKFFAPIDWTVKFYKWSVSSDPSDPHAKPEESALQKIFTGPPLNEVKADQLNFAGGAFDAVTGSDHFATLAEGRFTIQPGDYEIEITTDDGARVWLDGKPLIEEAWKYQGPTTYKRMVKLGAGEHSLRVEHFQIDGYAALKLSLKPRVAK